VRREFTLSHSDLQCVRPEMNKLASEFAAVHIHLENMHVCVSSQYSGERK
jgi:hypothetical protein